MTAHCVKVKCFWRNWLQSPARPHGSINKPPRVTGGAQSAMTFRFSKLPNANLPYTTALFIFLVGT